MNSDGKKISFGFSNRSKKPNILPPVPKKDENVELIECLEGAEIKVKNIIEKLESGPLVIPMKDKAGNIVDQIAPERIKVKKLDTKIDIEDSRPDSELTIEELAARQLLKEARNKLSQTKDTTKVHTLLLAGNTTAGDGKESSMDDYDNVPIEDFGLALLRGMGWKEEISNKSKFVTPDLRPKGLGLGGQKLIDVKADEVFDKNGEQLVLKEGAFAKIVAGPHKSTFCEVQFCDQWTGRVSVKSSKTNEILMLNELFVVPVTKQEYILGSKVINNAKYERYKENEAHSIKEDEVSSDGEYEKEGHGPRNKCTEQIRNDHTSSSSKNKSSIGYETHSKYEGDSPGENIRERSRTSNSRSREFLEREGEGSKIKKNHNSSGKYNRKKYEERTSKTRDRSRSSDRSMKYTKKKSHSRSRSSSSEDYQRHKSKSKNRNRSRSSSTEYTKHSIIKNHKKNEKRTSRYSDDEKKEKHSKKYRQYNDSEEQSSCEEKYRSKSKKNKKSRRRRYSSSESEYENRKSKNKEGKTRTENYKSRH